MPHEPDLRRRTPPSELPERMDEPCSRQEMRACLRDLAYVNRILFGYRPVLDWLRSLRWTQGSEPVRILDVGCGYGDTLRIVEQWAKQRQIEVELTGLDLNPDATAIAEEAAGSDSRIRWINGDVFRHKPDQAPHLVLSSLFTHHLSDPDVVRFLRWMEEHALQGWLVNDLSRHPTPYKLFRWFSRVMRLHPFVQHDGPVSIARAFVPQDWEGYCRSAGLELQDVEIRGFTPGRLCVLRSKTA